MKEIILSNSNLKVLVDDADYERLNKVSWRLNNSGYASRLSSRELMHCVLMEAKQIDHKDLNKLNNQRDNLRKASDSQNKANTPKNYTQGYTSKYKGVYWFERSKKKWRACVKKRGYKHYLGSFEFEIQAALAYDKKAIELFGEFARPNFIIT